MRKVAAARERESRLTRLGAQDVDGEVDPLTALQVLGAARLGPPALGKFAKTGKDAAQMVHMLTASNSAGSYTFHYDALGRLTSVDEPYGVSLAFSYDARGNRVLVVDSLGGTTSSKYDWANRLVSEVYTRSGSPTVRLDQQYDWAGRVTKQIRYSNAAGTAEIGESAFLYDADSRLIHQGDILSDGQVASPLNFYDYTYNLVGEVTAQTETLMMETEPRTFAYDAQGQLTSESNTPHGGTTHSYDAVGNRTNTGYQTGTANRLLSDGTWNYSYDNEGNQTAKQKISGGEHWSYAYDNVNHLVDAKDYDGGNNLLHEVIFTYDALGNRIKKEVDPAPVGPFLRPPGS